MLALPVESVPFVMLALLPVLVLVCAAPIMLTPAQSSAAIPSVHVLLLMSCIPSPLRFAD